MSEVSRSELRPEDYCGPRPAWIPPEVWDEMMDEDAEYIRQWTAAFDKAEAKTKAAGESG